VGSINYWVKISQRDESLGAGFILTSHLALTSSHCLKRIDRADSLLKLCFAGGEEVAGRVREYAEGANLALIDILEPLDGTLIPPASGRATEGDTWSAPYRPSTGDPHLNGQVVRGSIRYTCEAGAEIEALQLSCSQRIGDYSRYSGGPVERHLAGEVTLLGVLLEPYPDQQTAHRASDVLFAATIEEAGRRFKCLSAPHLLEFLSLSDGTSHEQFPARVSSQDDTGLLVQQANNNAFASPPLEQRIAAARSVLSALHELGISGVLDPLYVSKQKKRIVRRLVDSVWADENE
jgi:hypothetical protein